MPEIILRNINGVYFNGLYEKLERPELLKLYSDIYIIKPSLNSGGGKNVLTIRLSDSDIFIKDTPIYFDELERIFFKYFQRMNKIKKTDKKLAWQDTLKNLATHFLYCL